MPRRVLTLLALLCATWAVLPAVAVAAASSGTPAQAISDCDDHAQLTRYYSPSVLRQALAQMPADIKEYTDCYDVIERQLLQELSKGATAGTATPKPSSGGSFLPTWLIVVIVLLALAAVSFGALSLRRRRVGAAGGPPATAGPGAGAPASAPDAGAPASAPDAGPPASAPGAGPPASAPGAGAPASAPAAGAPADRPGEPGGSPSGGPAGA